MTKGNVQIFMEGDASGLGTAMQQAEARRVESLNEMLTPAGMAKVEAAEAELDDVLIRGSGDE
jgi:hypothetical protein